MRKIGRRLGHSVLFSKITHGRIAALNVSFYTGCGKPRYLHRTLTFWRLSLTIVELRRALYACSCAGTVTAGALCRALKDGVVIIDASEMHKYERENLELVATNKPTDKAHSTIDPLRIPTTEDVEPTPRH